MDEIVILLQAKPNKSELIIHGNKAEDTRQRHKWVRFPFICIRLERVAGADRRVREESSSGLAPLGLLSPCGAWNGQVRHSTPKLHIKRDQALHGVNKLWMFHPLNTAQTALAQQLSQTFPAFVQRHLEAGLRDLCELSPNYHFC